jgi:CheY-like chemotaxis protein
LQLDESKVPSGKFTVRCPKCQSLVRVQPDSRKTTSTQPVKKSWEINTPAPAFQSQKEAEKKEEKKEGPHAMKDFVRLLAALAKGDGNSSGLLDSIVDEGEKPHQVLVCTPLDRREVLAQTLADAGFKVYLAESPTQATERLREGKIEVLIFSPDFAAEFGGAAVIQQKLNSMPSVERRHLFVVSIEEGMQTLNAHEAFLRNLNLIIHNNDIAHLPIILNRAVRDFRDLYRHFNKAVKMASV